MNRNLITAAVTAFAVAFATQAVARDFIRVVGSSTVFPFATTVAEDFARSASFKMPRIESTGSGGGLRLFCAGVGVDHPDITNASRRIKGSEFDKCQSAGVTDIVEVEIGYDGIAIANSKEAEHLDLTPRDIFLALAREVPDPDGEDAEVLVANPYETWKEVNDALPDVQIDVLGPPSTSGTRDAFAELVMERGCDSFGFIKAIKKEDKNRFQAVCHGVREDGVYVEAGEDDNLIVQKLLANPKMLGIFGFSYLDQNSDKIQGSKVNGVEPTFESIVAGDYPVSRSLYFYVKKAQASRMPGIAEYVTEFTSDKAWGGDGYLADAGLIPLPDDVRSAIAKSAQGLVPMNKPEEQ